MSMSTEQAMSYIKGKAEEPEKVETAKEPETKEPAPSAEPEVKETKSEETDVSSPEDAAKAEEAKKDDGEQPKEEVKGSDEPKAETKDVKKEMSRQDYAFMKQKDKNRKLQDKYDKLNNKFNETTKQKDARIKELEGQLKKYEALKSEDFKRQDGSVDYDAYTNWKLTERDMQNEVSNLRQSMKQEQMQHALDYDRYVTERCFEGKELEDYNELVATKGGVFAEEIHKVDPNNVVFNYLETLNDYPIVLRELMTNPNKWLGHMFKSKDPDVMKWNTARVADAILEEHYKSKEQPAPPAKPAIPVIGKQIQNNNVSEPTVRDRTYWNNYLTKHPKG